MTDLTQGPAHARLSPSSAHRWMECPASANLALTVADSPTVYAAEGTMLHDITANVLTGCKPPPIGWVTEVDGFNFVLTEDHMQLVHWCVDKVREVQAQCPGAESYFEVKLPLPFIEPGSFGTSDVVICSYDTRTLYVYDHKFGGGVKVFAAENPQLVAYALGALEKYSLLDEFDRVVYGVLQPRLNHYDTSEMTIAQAHDWRARFRSAALATHAADAPLHAGDHCKFCPVKASCPELHTKALAAAQACYQDTPPAPSELTEHRIGEVLRAAPMVRAYLEAVEQEARRRLQVGLPVTGWKIVQGRGNRSWSSLTELREWAQGLIDIGLVDGMGQFHDAPSFLSPAQMEKACKTLGVDFPAAIQSKAFGAPSVVPESDKRPSLAAMLDVIPEDSSILIDN